MYNRALGDSTRHNKDGPCGLAENTPNESPSIHRITIQTWADTLQMLMLTDGQQPGQFVTRTLFHKITVSMVSYMVQATVGKNDLQQRRDAEKKCIDQGGCSV